MATHTFTHGERRESCRGEGWQQGMLNKHVFTVRED